MNAPIDVLLVEDDPLTVLNMKRALRGAPEIGSVSVACDGIDALGLLLGGTLASARLVVITDLAMPRMSGLELLAAIRAHADLRAVPVVVLSTSDREQDRRAAVALDVAAYLVKDAARPPFAELLRCITRLCIPTEAT